MNGRTDRKSIEGMYRRVLGAILFLGLVALCAAPSWAQSTQSSAKAPAHAAASAAKAPATRAKSGGGNHEGITVHGWWVIEVKNPDGKITARREFENTLTPLGINLLTSLLYGQSSPGFWAIDIGTGTNTGGPCSPAYDCSIQMPGIPVASGDACYAYQPPPPLSAIPTAPCSNNLTPSIVSQPLGPITVNALQLSGSVVATSIGEINAVRTDLLSCTSGSTSGSTPSSTLSPVSPAGCLSGPVPPGAAYNIDLGFTSASIPAINNIQAGQTISVTVTISFSPAS